MTPPPCREVTACRVCGGPLETVLALGRQCLGGQFPLPAGPDPPAFPLTLCRCAGECGLVQLGHTVDPKLMFTRYGYRSGVTATMKMHLGVMAKEGADLAGLTGREGGNVLDIGGNDGTLLSYIHPSHHKYLVDPSDVSVEPPLPYGLLSGFWPNCLPSHGKLNWGPFDLIFSVAVFYDSDDPVGFARAVRDNLAPDGVWCVEVANFWDALASGAYDGVCHEHLLYFDPESVRHVLKRAGLRVVRSGVNNCNGGSLRLFCCRQECDRPYYGEAVAPRDDPDLYVDFAERVADHAARLRDFLAGCLGRGESVHLLGASTKANTWLQLALANAGVIRCASDRDPRKHGRVTPGTRIPILSEEHSRMMEPDVYLVGPWHFRDEVVAREREFLARGGRLVFVLPDLEEVRADGKRPSRA